MKSGNECKEGNQDIKREVKTLEKRIRVLERGIDAFQRLGIAYRLGQSNVPKWVFEAIDKVEKMYKKK